MSVTTVPSTQSPTQATGAALDRLAGAGGLVFAAILVADNIIRASAPGFDAAPAQVSAYFLDHRAAALVPLGLLPAGLALFLFAAGLRARARQEQSRWWAGVGVLGAATPRSPSRWPTAAPGSRPPWPGSSSGSSSSSPPASHYCEGGRPHDGKPAGARPDTCKEMAVNQQAAPYVLAAGQARSHPGAFPAIKAGAADTGGLFTFCDGMLAPRTPGPALHVHDETDECLYVIDGHLLVQAGEERHDLGPGCFAWLPRQIPHTYANASDSPVRAVSMHVPGGIEKLFAAQGAYFAQLHGPPDPKQIAAIWAGHPGRILGPPIQVDATPAASRA